MKRLFIFVLALFMFGACNALDLMGGEFAGCTHGYYVSGTSCVKCPDGTTTPRPDRFADSIYHHYTQCAPAWLRYIYTPPVPEGALATKPITKSISLNTEKQTKPALAMRVGDKTMYANLSEVTSRTDGNIYISYNNKTYKVKDNNAYKFTITTTNMTAGTEFRFYMTAKGTFYVDWGDGTLDEIIRTNTTQEIYTHKYTTAGVRTIKMGGLATGYETGDTRIMGAIRFSGNTNIAKLSGSLGAIFPTIGDGVAAGTQPSFTWSFIRCTELTSISPELFSGVRGAATNMFEATFAHCTGLTNLPSGLFSGIYGSAPYMFAETFSDCTGLTGEIPLGFFGNPSGAPAYGMFGVTFYGCTNLNGPTARMADGTYLYDIVNPATGETWWNEMPDTFGGMYIGTKITGVR